MATAIDTPDSGAAAMHHSDLTDNGPKQTYRSYKKKYRKMRHTFEDKMKVSNTLFSDEQKAIKTARRLQEQNDQLLDLLLEVNESYRIPPNLRYDIRSRTPSESAVPALELDTLPLNDPSSARAALEEAKLELLAGQISLDQYKSLEADFAAIISPKSLSKLNMITPHTVLDFPPFSDLPHDLGSPNPTGYLTPSHEEEYLSTLDAALEVSEPGSQSHPSSHPIRSNEKHEKERDAALRNPVSVYNWLRKHQPQVFLQDNESPPEKPTPKPQASTRTPKRSSIIPRQEPQIFDDDGFLINPETSTRSKRKREDEPYRPKGGSSRVSKKKKVSGGLSDKRRAADEEGL